MSSKEYKKMCEYCGKAFVARSKRGSFCSRKCKDISYRIKNGIKCNTNTEPYKKECACCGRVFETFRHDVKTCSTYCSQKMRGELKVNEYKPEKHSIADRIDERFDFVSYEKGKVKIKCKKCGFVSEKYKSTIYRSNQRCDNCIKNERHLDELRKELCKVLSLCAELKKDKVCAKCGAVFHSEINSKKYCCEKCKKKAHKKGNSKYRQRAKRYGVEYDGTITLKKVYKRDGGICQICGKPTDWKSNEWNGTFGANYPTVDHIKALANGGSHTWDNVQLAHAFCNSCKRDLM